MKKYLFPLFLFTICFFLSSCREDTSETKINNNSSSLNTVDTSSVFIDYEISGSGNGSIKLFKRGDEVRYDISKTTNNESTIESIFISGGYLHFYMAVNNGMTPVKMPVVKDHNYYKSFSALADAASVIEYLKKNGEENFLGYTCTVYLHSDGSEFSVLDGKYILKASYDGMNIKAVNFNKDTLIRKSYVSLPADVEFTDLTEVR